MRLDDEQESSNVEDRRGMSFGGGRMLIGGGGLGAVVVVILALVFGVDPRSLLGGGDGGQVAPGPPGYAAPGGPQGPREDDPEYAFSRKVLHSTETVWTDVLARHGRHYDPPTLVVYDEATPTEGCGTGQEAMGPFYCPGDAKVYLDLAFFRELSSRFGAPGDFARAYVIAHEVGHHLQNVLGIEAKARGQLERGGGRGANGTSVRLELQADCFAGVWANHAQDKLDPGDIQAGLQAASAVGDDRLQKQTQGRVVPDAFTHGTSAQRMRWFEQGFDSGDIDHCDTFGTDRL